ncbi:MAG: hypothetical protein H7835_07245 [Magnetococcus sp. XQGC-1]
MARARKQQGETTTQAAQTAAQWPVGDTTTSTPPLVSDEPEREQEQNSPPLTPLTLDTVLTVGDLQRIMKIVSSSS